jgi:hypothetical protein
MYRYILQLRIKLFIILHIEIKKSKEKKKEFTTSIIESFAFSSRYPICQCLAVILLLRESAGF